LPLRHADATRVALLILILMFDAELFFLPLLPRLLRYADARAASILRSATSVTLLFPPFAARRLLKMR